MKKLLLFPLCCLVTLVFLTGGAWGTEFCVDPGGGGDYMDLQAALTYAQANGEDDIIKVVQGTYTGNFNYRSNEGYSITVLGGYTAACAGRIVDPANTVLDGNNTGRVLQLNNYTNGGNISLEGFTIRGGKCQGPGGGGLAASYSDFRAGTITLTGNTFTGNSSTSNGGGVMASSSGATGSGQITLTGNNFTGNTAGYTSYGSNGGGAFVESYSGLGTAGTITLTGNIITGNSTSPGGYGGGVWARSYGALSGGQITLVNNIITGNLASDGGGVLAFSSSSSTVTFTNNTITANTAIGRGGGVFLYILAIGGTVNYYNNICWGNTALAPGGDVYLFKEPGPGIANAYHNDVGDVAGDAWDNDVDNIDRDPLFADPGYWDDNGTPDYYWDDFGVNGDYHLQPLSPCIDKGDNGAPEFPSADFEGDDRIIDGDNDGTATADMGAYEYTTVILEAPSNGAIFAACSLINKYQPSFQWIDLEPFQSFTILFFTSSMDFPTKESLIIKASIPGTKSSWTPSIWTWNKIMAASYNSGSIRPIYWKVVGKRAGKTTAESAVRYFGIDDPLPPEIKSPANGAILLAVTPPTFIFDTNCNVLFRLEISSLGDFSDHKQIKRFTYMVRDPNVTGLLQKTLSPGQWYVVKKFIRTGTGYFRIRAWDGIYRKTASETRPFTIQY